jgi:hypothetical protein
VVIASYNQHIGSFSPEPFGWLAPPSLLGAREPTLSWNQLHSLRAGRYRPGTSQPVRLAQEAIKSRSWRWSQPVEISPSGTRRVA